MQPSLHKLSIVFSFRNEQENLIELLYRVDNAVKKTAFVEHEYIFVNDYSTDNSLDLLIDLQKNYPIVVINMSRNFGVTPCVMAGLEYSSGDAVIYLDSDLQDPPELIPEMVKLYMDGADAVHTIRLSRAGEGIIKLWLTSLAYKTINLFSSIKLTANSGDYKLLSRRVANSILALTEYDLYMRALSVWVGYNQKYIYYDREPRFSGNSKFPLYSRGPINEFIRGLTAYSAGPLYLALVLGIFASLVGILLILYAVITKIIGAPAYGSTGILIAIAFFSSAILITNGIIGIYISKIYYEVKGRPKYIVSNIIERNHSK